MLISQHSGVANCEIRHCFDWLFFYRNGHEEVLGEWHVVFQPNNESNMDQLHPLRAGSIHTFREHIHFWGELFTGFYKRRFFFFSVTVWYLLFIRVFFFLFFSSFVSFFSAIMHAKHWGQSQAHEVVSKSLIERMKNFTQCLCSLLFNALLYPKYIAPRASIATFLTMLFQLGRSSTIFSLEMSLGYLRVWAFYSRARSASAAAFLFNLAARLTG